jgi:hypothetical protein
MPDCSSRSTPRRSGRRRVWQALWLRSQDPRYYRSLRSGFWHRSAHALRGTILTRTDSGGETLSTWRIGSAYGAAFLSNFVVSARLDTARQGFVDGSLGLGLSFASNLGAEFWPDPKKKVFRRK